MDGDRHKLAQIFRQCIQTIIDGWKESVRRELPRARELSTYALEDSLPKFLDELAEFLVDKDLYAERIKAVAREHGQDRAENSDFSLVEMIEEYRLLRIAVIEGLLSRTSLPSDVLADIHSYIDKGMLRASQEFIETQQFAEKHRLHQVLTGLPVGVAILEGKDFVYTFSNEAHQRLFGRKEIIGKTIQETVPVSQRESIYELLRGVVETGESFEAREFAISLVQEDGAEKEYILNFVYKPLQDSQGRNIGVVASVQDITQGHRALLELKRSEQELKNTEEQLSLALEGARMGTWHIDLETQFVTTSKGFAKIFGVSAVEGNIFEEISRYMHPEDVEEVNLVWTTAVETQKPYLHEYRIIWPDGSIRWVESRGSVKFDALGKPVVFSGILSDVTERVLVRKEMEEEKELRERFVLTLTHDLRNPLMAARMIAQLEGKKSVEPRAQRNMERITVNIDRADRMIRDILDANRLKAGDGIPLTAAGCDLSAILHSVIDQQRELHGDRFVLKESINQTVFWDGAALERLLENLCGNAVKYGEPGTLITISSRPLPGAKIGIDVHNNGLISPEDQRSLFKLFGRGETAKASQQKGWGIGLTIVKGIAEGHGGAVTVKSDSVSGTTFTIELPLDSRPFLPPKI